MTDKQENDEVNAVIGTDPERTKVLIHFSAPISWIGFDREKALIVGQAIIDKANLIADAKSKDPVENKSEPAQPPER